MYDILEANYRWIEPKNHKLTRENGASYFILAQFHSEICLEISGRFLNARPGNFLIVPPKTSHSYICQQDLLHHWIHVESDLTALLARYDIQAGQLYELYNAEEVSFLFHQISLAFHGRDPYRQEYLSLKIEELLLTIGAQLRSFPKTRHLNYSIVQRLKSLRTHMLEHPEQDFSIAAMAEEVYLSQPYFQQVYKEYFGITPKQDLIAIRIHHAQTNLLTGHSVEETAERCGYQNVEHFIRQFKKYTDQTPSHFKRTHSESS